MNHTRIAEKFYVNVTKVLGLEKTRKLVNKISYGR